MIQLIEVKDIEDLWKAWDKINERTKIHTKQIHELQKALKQLNQGGKKNGE